MSEKIDRFCENLRVKLTDVEDSLRGLESKIDDKTQRAEQHVQNHLDQVKTRIERDHADVVAAKAEVKNWLEEKNAATSAKIADWKSKREIAKLRQRADAADRYAMAATQLAEAALDEAEQASIEAWLARQDAEAAAA